jgi:hypothetical protein
MKSSTGAAETPDLDFHWDPKAHEKGRVDNGVTGLRSKRNLEDYFSFLSDVDPAQDAIKQPPELFKKKFTF